MEKDQIEKMAKIIKAVKYEPFNDGKPTYTVGNQMQDFVFSLIAEELLKYYQPKLPEDSVVLSREEYEKLKQYEEKVKNGACFTQKEWLELCDEEYKRETENLSKVRQLERKETAEKILNEILFVESVEGWEENEQLVKFSNKIVDKIEELANKYGVEAHDDRTRTN